MKQPILMKDRKQWSKIFSPKESSIKWESTWLGRFLNLQVRKGIRFDTEVYTSISASRHASFSSRQDSVIDKDNEVFEEAAEDNEGK